MDIRNIRVKNYLYNFLPQTASSVSSAGAIRHCSDCAIKRSFDQPRESIKYKRPYKQCNFDKITRSLHKECSNLANECDVPGPEPCAQLFFMLHFWASISFIDRMLQQCPPRPNCTQYQLTQPAQPGECHPKKKWPHKFLLFEHVADGAA